MNFIFRMGIVLAALLVGWTLIPHSIGASTYRGIDIPVMDKATNISIKQNDQTGIHSVEYEIYLMSHEQPLHFYHEFFATRGWDHFMSKTYKQFPQQFDSPPHKKWSSFATQTNNGNFSILLSTLWENDSQNTYAHVTLRLIEPTEFGARGSLKVIISPKIDTSVLDEVFVIAEKDPLSLLELSTIAGGDPFDINAVNFEAILSTDSENPLFIKYQKAIRSIHQKIEESKGLKQ